MNRSALVGVTLCVALTLVVVAGSGVLAASDSPLEPSSSLEAADTDTYTASSPTASPPSSSQSQSLSSTVDATSTTGDFDTTTYVITVHEDGSATWTFRHERILSDSDDEEAFETFADEFETEDSDLYTGFVDQSQALTELGNEETEREMEATDFNRTASIEQGFNTRGVVEMSFTWTNFAQVDNDRIIVGDVFDGSFFIGSDQSLVIESDDPFVFDDIEPSDGITTGDSLEDTDSVTWQGSKQFVDGQPRVVFVDETTISESNSDEEVGATGPEDGSALPEPRTIAAAALVALILGGGAVGAARYGRLPFGRDGDSAPDQRPTPTDGPITDTATTSESATAADPIPDDELLSDEDRVVSLIKENGGRMKQVNIVDETGWSKSKVSMLLSEMESDGTISKLRVGRENIISLEGFEPEATKSPFDE